MAGAPVFVKLGGSLITDKTRPYTTRPDVIQRICAEIHAARPALAGPLLVAHGGGSFPHVSASRFGTNRGAHDERGWEGFAQVQDDAARLNRIVVGALLKAGERAVSIQPSAGCLARRGRIESWSTESIERCLEHRVLPVPYGDVCFDEEQGCAVLSTEELFRFLAPRLRPERIILAGRTDGVLDERGRTIERITRENYPGIKRALQDAEGFADVTGGMVHKLDRALETGVPCQIINGLEDGQLERALGGESGLGTMVTAGPVSG